MKKIIMSLALGVFAVAANAQIVKNLEYPKAHFGIRGAFTLNSISKNSEYFDYDSKSLPFASAGFAADFKIASIPLYLETGLYYMNKGYKYDSYYDEDETENDHSVVMPLLASYHLYLNDNMSVQPFVGPYVGYGIDQERVDYGIRVGCGWNMGRLYANVGYDFGFEVDDYKNNTFFLTIGFNFAGSY